MFGTPSALSWQGGLRFDAGRRFGLGTAQVFFDLSSLIQRPLQFHLSIREFDTIIHQLAVFNDLLFKFGLNASELLRQGVDAVLELFLSAAQGGFGFRGIAKFLVRPELAAVTLFAWSSNRSRSAICCCISGSMLARRTD